MVEISHTPEGRAWLAAHARAGPARDLWPAIAVDGARRSRYVRAVDQYDILAVILGVMFTLRKLDTQSRNATQQPNVPAEDFTHWQRQTVAAYAPGMYASFFRVIFHFGYIRYAAHHPLSPQSFRRVALLVDLIWLVATITTFIRANAARELRRKLGIVLEKPAPTR
jgi:hypothetical protein